MRIEVGKKYLADTGDVYKIAYHENNFFIGFVDVYTMLSFSEDGEAIELSRDVNLLKEHVEPYKESTEVWFNDLPEKYQSVVGFISTTRYRSLGSENDFKHHFSITLEQINE